METNRAIDLKELFNILMKKWWLVLLLTAMGFLVAYLITSLLITPMYETQTVLYIGKEDAGLGTIDISLGKLQADSRLIVDYKQLAVTRLVIDSVAANTGLTVTETVEDDELTNKEDKDPRQMTYKKFRDSIIIRTVEDSRLFTVGFSHPDPQIAKEVSDELAKQLAVVVLEIVGVENIRILDQALVPDKPVSPKVIQNTLIGGFLGLILAMFLVFLMFLFSDRIMNDVDVENLINVPVLGEIPVFKKE